MKTVAITGTTRGLGKALSLVFQENGYKVIHLNRPDFDISTFDLEKVPDFDIFINNAYSDKHGYAQTDIAYAWFNKFKDTDKHLVNIGSVSSDGDRPFVHPYAVHKTALEKASIQLQFIKSKCKVTLIKPSWIDTDRIKKVEARKMDPFEISEYIYNVTQIPGDMYVKSITFEIKQP